MNTRIFFALFVVLALLCAPVFSTEFDSDVDADVDVDVESHVEAEHEVESTHEVEAEHEVDVESAAEHWVDMEVEGSSSSSTGAPAPAPIAPYGSSTGSGYNPTAGSTGVAFVFNTTALYLAIPRGAVTAAQMACVIKQGVRTVGINGVSKRFMANAKIVNKAGAELHAFYTPKIAPADFLASATTANATRVWVRVGGKYYEDKDLKKNFQNVVIAVKELSKGKYAGRVGIYASKKSWIKIMGAKVNGGALRAYPLWLASGSQFAAPKNSAKGKIAKLAQLAKNNGKKVRSFLQIEMEMEMETPPKARQTQGKPVSPKAARQAAVAAAKAAAKSAKVAPVTGTVFDKAWKAVVSPTTGKAGKAVCGLPSDLSTGANVISSAIVGGNDAPIVGNSANPIVAVALSLTGKGTKYLYGGDGLKGKGIDCSHFVQSVYEKAGKKYPFTATAAWPAKQFVRTTTPKAGDVIMFSGHMAIYQDATTMIGSQSSTGPARAACPGPYWGSSKGKPITSYWTWRG